jgi:uncharacterized protein (DUF885 family)/cyclophilin family peptidyl-prolyl cis-trans isomerase
VTQPVRVRLETAQGDLLIELMVAQAPLTCAAFLRCIDEQKYGGVAFARAVRADNDNGSPAIEVLQTTAADLKLATGGVPHESTADTGLKHVDGTVSLARAAPGTSDPRVIFICIGDQPALNAGGERNADRLGFAAFAKVVEGMEVVRAIHSAPTTEEAPHEYVAGQILAERVPVISVRRESDPEEGGTRLQELAAEYWEYRLREYPTEATMAGDKRYNRLMDRTSLADHARRANESAVMLARLETIAPSGLAAQDALTQAMLRRQLLMTIESYRCGEHLMPPLFPFGFQDVTRFLAESTPLHTQRDFEDFIARLQAMGPYLDENMECLEEGVKRGYRLPRAILSRAIPLLDAQLAPGGLIAVIEEKFAGKPPPGLHAAGLAELRAEAVSAVESAILPALRRLKARLENGNELARQTVAIRDLPVGEIYYRFKVRQQTSCDLSPDEIHAIGLEEVAELLAQCARIAASAGFRGPHAYAEFLQHAVEPNAAALLERARALAKRIDGLLPRLFDRFPAIPYGVSQLTPEQSQAMPPANAQPGTADRSMPGIFWLTALPERCPPHLLIPLTLHEAWPGHLMQIARAQELVSLPAFRRNGMADYNGYIEGWALYCERLGHDLGLYDDTADAFGHISFDLWRAARLVVDTGLHCKGWTRQEAIDYLASTCFLPRDTIESEVDRYIGMPAQALTYKLGERAIRSLRAEAESRLGSRFSIRVFHDQILSIGPVPLTDLERHVRAWIERVAALSTEEAS